MPKNLTGSTVVLDLTNPTILGWLANARNYEQYCQMYTDFANGKCAFCDDMARGSLHKIGIWHLKKNDFPYKYSRHHLLMVPDTHVADPAQLTREDWADMHDLMAWAVREFEIPGGGLVMRFGDMRYHAGTMRHLHVHIQVPDGKGQVKATFAKSLEKIEEDRQKVAGFEARRLAGEKPNQG